MKNIIIFSSIDWEDNWQLHQEISSYFRSLGYKVLYVENTGIRTLDIKKDFTRIVKRIKHVLYSNFGFTIKNQISILSPIIIPTQTNKFFLKINSGILSYQIKKWLSINNIDNFIFLSFLPTPLVFSLVPKIKPNVVSFYYADSMSEKSYKTKYLKEWENKFCKESDIVFTTSKMLHNKILKLNSNSYHFPAGVNSEGFKKYKKTRLIKKNTKKKIVGYVGAFSDVVDQELLIKAAQFFKEIDFIFIGPHFIKINPNLKKLENVKFYPKTFFPKLFEYYFKIDVGIIPYKINKFTKTVFPTKLSEYLASDCSVVSTNLPELKKLNKNLVLLASTHDDFIKKINLSLELRSDKKRKQIISEYLQKNSWFYKFEKIANLIGDIAFKNNLLEQSDSVKIIKTKFKSFFRNLINYTATLILFYLIIFKSPLMNYVAKPLFVKEQSYNNEAIVIFSGYGDLNYSSIRYRLRVKEAISLYKENKKKLILSSGKAFVFSEVEIITAILQYNGVDKEDIYVFKKFPSSTFENVKMVLDYLDKQGIGNFVSLTEPLHQKRLQLTLMKHNKKKDRQFSFYSNHEDFLKFKTLDLKINFIKKTFYEYIALIHNYLHERI